MKSISKNAISARVSSRKIIAKESEDIAVPSLKVEVDYKITGKDGERKGTIECKCFVKQFGQLLHMMFGGLTNYSVKDTAGATKTPSAFLTDYRTLGCNASAGVDNHGIVVGLDNTAVDINDYVLASKCAHGTGADEFTYGGPVGFTITNDDTSNTLKITRPFGNGSGSSIVVKEIGLIVYNNAGYFLVLRDIIDDPGLEVGSGETLTVNYKIKAIA
ncbi:unnamed protein product [marine sediment metagenome]|uniref:Uncharacterized protein n=1 Tax=marine sediment metagenome TaxID=412755 RepID=X0VAH3_9ZZZZ